ncbi:LOW QUALITY PROTEIN: polysaccharide biosynthesis protein [Bacillus sp. JCM 19046]|nr:LOW QUALITY PROTEIN: polysaccharide biosynthesis protein [Bacillus sp. JCM 19045]GAF15774.1 LOW QUALITY PROTEIN: polysaccharide biosynthesis protein [Bacillus sp. JCM 19046]
MLGLALASLFIWFGYAEIGLLLGLIGGLLLSTMPLFRKRWGFSIKPALVSLPLLRSYAAYGLPLTITLLLGMIIHQSDRFIIGAMMGVEATGSYAVTYDLTEQSIFTLLLIVNLAAFPLAVKKLDNEGEQAANRQVKANMTLLLAIGLPMLIGFVMARESIATLFLGEAFRDTAVSLIPFIAVGALLKGFKLYGIDILFHLKNKRSYKFRLCLLLWPMSVRSGSFSYGLQGAAIATVIAYALAILSSWFLLYFHQTTLPFPVKGFVKIMCAGTVMFFALLPFSSESSAFALISQILIGIFSYSVVLGLLSVKQIRLFLRKRTKQNETA